MQDPKVQNYIEAKYKHAIQLAKTRTIFKVVMSKILSIKRELQRINKDVERAVNTRGFMSDIVARRFASQGEGWKKWKACDVHYMMSKKKGNKPILYLTGTLMKESKRAVKNTYNLEHNFNWPSLYSSVTSYASYVAETRPFLDNPTDDELRDADNFARKYFVELVRRKVKS